MCHGFYDSFSLCFYDSEEAACAAAVKLDVKRVRLPRRRNRFPKTLLVPQLVARIHCSAWRQGWAFHFQNPRHQERKLNGEASLRSLARSATRST